MEIGMKKTNVLVLAIGMASLGAGVGNAISQSDLETHRSRSSSQSQTGDAVMEAQTSRQVPLTRPEQRKNEHDQSNVFAAANAKSVSNAFENQPDKGKVLGFDFSRDPFNAKKPMQTFEEIMKMDVADCPKVMKTQRDLLMQRYNLTPRLDSQAKMSRGKPLPVGPTARLPGGVSWQKLASMTPEQIRSQNLFPYPSLPHPKQATGGQVFPQMQIDMFPRLQRFDVDFD